jgi:hypothetical protein
MNVLHWLGPVTVESSRPWATPETCDRATLLLNPCDMFFSASVTPAERWSFKLGMVMTLLTIRLTIIERCERKRRSSLGSCCGAQKPMWAKTSGS